MEIPSEWSAYIGEAIYADDPKGFLGRLNPLTLLNKTNKTLLYHCSYWYNLSASHRPTCIFDNVQATWVHSGWMLPLPTKLENMRNHVGYILRSMRVYMRTFIRVQVHHKLSLNRFDSPSNHNNLEGGLDGCNVRPTKKPNGSRSSISRSCKYHYAEMIYRNKFIKIPHTVSF